MLFLDPKTKLTPLSVVKESTGTVTVSKTGKTEKTVLMYNPEGILSYFNLADGSKVQEFEERRQENHLGFEESNIQELFGCSRWRSCYCTRYRYCGPWPYVTL
jgi:hypothetical protein